MKTQNKSSEARKSAQEIQRRSAAAALSPWEEMERFFENTFPPSLLRYGRGPWPEWSPRFGAKLPAVDVIGRADHILVRAEVPGVKKENLDVSVSDNMVTIRGTSKHEEEKEEGQYFRREMTRGEYSRSIGLPAEVDSAKAKATFKDGVLELKLPKTAPSQRHSVKVE